MRLIIGLVIRVLAAALVALLAFELVHSALLTSLDARLADAGANANAQVVEIERAHLILVRGIHATKGAGETLVARDAVGLQELVEPLQANSQVSMVDLVDTSGTMILAVRGEGAPGPPASRADWPLIQQALLGTRDDLGERTASLLVAREGPLLATVSPMRVGDQIVGAVIVGTPLPDIVDRMVSPIPAVMTVYDSAGNPLATSFDQAPPVLPAADAAEIVRPQGPAVPRLFSASPIKQRELLGLFIVRHNPAGVLGVAMVDDTVETSLFIAFLVWLGATLLLVVAAILDRRRVTSGDERDSAP